MQMAANIGSAYHFFDFILGSLLFFGVSVNNVISREPMSAMGSQAVILTRVLSPVLWVQVLTCNQLRQYSGGHPHPT
jgi:hypothetical protein